MAAASSRNRLQFSMKALLAIFTLTCVILAIPGGFVLLIVGTLWWLIGAALVTVLMFFKAKIYRFLSGLRNADNQLP